MPKDDRTVDMDTAEQYLAAVRKGNKYAIYKARAALQMAHYAKYKESLWNGDCLAVARATVEGG